MQKKNLVSLSASTFAHKPERRSDYSLRLDYNELPYSAAWLGSEDGSCSHALNRYPEDDNEALARKISQTYRLPIGEIAVTHGIDEAMDRFIQLHTQKSFILFKPTFFGFVDRLEANDAVFRTHDLGQDFKITPSDYENISKNDVVVLASPNNPTGHLFEDSEIEKLLQRAAAVLVDETYIDFSSSTGWLSNRSNNLFVYRSFSKSFGLAGLRAGFLVGPSQAMEKIRKKQWFCNMSSPVINALCQALGSDWHLQRAKEIVGERDRIAQEMQRMGFEVTSTETNFLLMKDPSGVIENALERHSIKVRPLTAMGMPDYLRVSIHAPENNNLLLQALATIPSRYYSVLHGLHKIYDEWREKPYFGLMQPEKSKNWVVRKAG